MEEIVRYSLSADGKGLIGYSKDGNFCHIHSKEMNDLQKWIHGVLTETKRLEAFCGLFSSTSY